jgi:hypothetical protein
LQTDAQKERAMLKRSDRADGELKLAWPAAIHPIGLRLAARCARIDEKYKEAQKNQLSKRREDHGYK